MESDHSKIGNSYQIFLVIGLFLFGSTTLVCASTSMYHWISIDNLERNIEIKKYEEGVDPEYIERLNSSLEYEKHTLVQNLISMGISIGFLIGFILLEKVYLKANTEPFRQDVSASERIEFALREQSGANNQEKDDEP